MRELWIKKPKIRQTLFLAFFGLLMYNIFSTKRRERDNENGLG